MLSRRTLCCAFAAAPLAAAWPCAAVAADNYVSLMHAAVMRRNDGCYVDAQWEFDLANTLIESLQRGIALYFVCQFRLQKKRWYWFDKDVDAIELVQRLSFSPLSRNYRLSCGGLSQTFETLEQALPVVKNVREWRVCDPISLKNIDDYEAEVRLRLDSSRLPKPLKVTIGGNSDWDLDSDWVPAPIAVAK